MDMTMMTLGVVYGVATVQEKITEVADIEIGRFPNLASSGTENKLVMATLTHSRPSAGQPESSTKSGFSVSR
jgi:hypothetical protein